VFWIFLLFIVLQTVGNSTMHARCGPSHLSDVKHIYVWPGLAEVVVPVVGTEEVISTFPPAAEDVVPVPLVVRSRQWK
jgi:hypothetical protein